MRQQLAVYLAFVSLMLASCSPPPAVDDSREALWQQFGHQNVDNLLMSWGAPERETRLTDGSRMVTYRHSTVYEAQSPYERVTSCEASFIAKAPSFRIEDVAMEGNPYECNQLAHGHTGELRSVFVPSAYPDPYPYPYHNRPY